MPALLFVGHLILNLDCAGTRLNHFLSQQVCGFLVTKAGINICNDWHHVSLKLINLLGEALNLYLVASLFRCIQLAEQPAKLTGIGLAQKGVQLLNQTGDRRFFVHGLVGEWPKFRAKSRDHPPREIQIFFIRGTEMLLNGNQFLLADKPMPTAKGLCVTGRIRIVGGHIRTH